MNVIGLPVIYDEYEERTISNAVWKLKKQGYATDHNGLLYITARGSRYSKIVTSKKLKHFKSPFPKNASRNLLVLYDISEDKKKEREWFRYHLRKFGYKMIQRSVWIGPSPLPRDFILYVKSIGLKKSIKTHKIAK